MTWPLCYVLNDPSTNWAADWVTPTTSLNGMSNWKISSLASDRPSVVLSVLWSQHVLSELPDSTGSSKRNKCNKGEDSALRAMSSVNRIAWIQYKTKWNNLHLIRTSTKHRGYLLARKSAILIVLQIHPSPAQQLGRNSLLWLGRDRDRTSNFFRQEKV